MGKPISLMDVVEIYSDGTFEVVEGNTEVMKDDGKNSCLCFTQLGLRVGQLRN